MFFLSMGLGKRRVQQSRKKCCTYDASANRLERSSRRSLLTHSMALATSSLFGTFLPPFGMVLRQRCHSSSKSRYLNALSNLTSPLLTIWTTLLLINLLLVTISSPASTLSIHSCTAIFLNADNPTSRSIGYTSAGLSALRFGLGIGLAWSASFCISSRVRIDVAEAAIVSRRIAVAGSRLLF